MLPISQPYQVSATGDSGAPLFQDVGTRTLRNVRVGENAGKLASGSENVFTGYEAGREARSVTQSVCIGYQAGATTFATQSAVFIGAFAGAGNKGGAESVFIGFRAGETNFYGDTLTAVGAYAMRENYSGSRSTAVGYRAMERILDGDDNTAVGAEACQGMRSGGRNTAMGFRAGRGAQGSEHCYFGAFAGYSNAEGFGNALFGYRSGEFLINGSFNVGVGPYTLQYATLASSNIAIGAFAGASLSSGSGSVIIGFNAGASNANGSGSVILGTNAGAAATGGDDNVLIGAEAAIRAGGNRMVVVGAHAAPDIHADGSVIIGYETAINLIYGASNILVGPGANTYTTTNYNGICIGTQNCFTSDYTVTIGEDIQNKRARSILVGFALQSDANNSVIVGNDITLQSVLFFKDPISQAFVEAVRADAAFKFGISAITYGTDNQLLVSPPPESTAFLYGTAGLLTSNIVSTETSVFTSPDAVSPASYDLRDFLVSARGSNLVQLRPTALPMRSNADLLRVVSFSNQSLNTVYAENSGGVLLPFGLPTAPSPISTATSNLLLVDALYTASLTVAAPAFTLAPPPAAQGVVVNFQGFSACNAALTFPLPKRAATPRFVTSASNITGRPIDTAAILSAAMALSNEISYAPTPGAPADGIQLLDPILLAGASPALRESLAASNAYVYRIVGAAPVGGSVAIVSDGLGGSNLTYAPYPEMTAAVFQETFSLEPVLQIQGAGIPPSAAAPAEPVAGGLSFTVSSASLDDPVASNIYVTDRITLAQGAMSFPFTASDVLGIPALPGNTGIRFTEISPELQLRVSPGAAESPAAAYTSNALAEMIAEQMDLYATVSESLYVGAVHTLATQTVAKNAGYLDTYVAPYILGFSNATVSLSNAVALAAVAPAAAYTDLDAMLGSADALRDDFAGLTYAPPTAADVTGLIGLKNAWFTTYDPTNVYTAEQTEMTTELNTVFTNYVFTDFLGYHSNVLLYTLGASASNLASFYPTHVGLSNTLRGGYDFGDPPSPIGNAFATSNIILAMNALDVVNYKYRVRSDLRLYLTVADLNAGRISFSNAAAPPAPTAYDGAITLKLQWPPSVVATTEAPAYVGPYTIPVAQHTTGVWSAFPYAATQISLTAPSAGSALLPTPLSATPLPATGALYVVQEPAFGSLVLPSVADGQFSNVRYTVTQPWRTLADTDTFTLIAAADATGSGLATVVTATVATVAGAGGSGGAVGPIPVPAAARQWTITEITSNVFSFTQETYLASNVDVYSITQDGVVTPTYTVVQPIASYDPLLGFHTRSSNIAESSNFAVTSATPAGSGEIAVTYNYRGFVDTSNMFDANPVRVIILNDVTLPAVPNTLYPDENSNITVTNTLQVYDFNGYAFDTTYSRRAFSYSNTDYLTHNDIWLASNETLITLGPAETEIFATETVLSEGPLLYNTTSNYLFSSNIVQKDPYALLNRHYLYAPPADGSLAAQSAVTYTSVAGDGTVVLGVYTSNSVGAAALTPRTAFTQTDIASNNLYVRLAPTDATGGASALGALSFTVTAPGAYAVPTAATIAFKTLTTPNNAPATDTPAASALTVVLDPVTLQTTPANAIAGYFAPANNPDYTPLSGSGAPVPKYITFKPTPADAASPTAVAAGYFYYVPTGERRLTYELADLSNVRYVLPHPGPGAAGPDTDRIGFYYTADGDGGLASATALASEGIYQVDLAFYRTAYDRGQDFNLGLTVAPASNILSPEAFYQARPGKTIGSMGVKLTNAGVGDDVTASKTEFTFQELVDRTVTITADTAAISAGDTFAVTYDLYANLADVSPFEIGRTFQLRFYDAPMFPREEAFAAALSNVGASVLRQSAYGTGADDGSLRAVGDLWQTLAAATVQGVPISPSNVCLDLLQNAGLPAHGFLRKPFAGEPATAATVYHELALADLLAAPSVPVAASNVVYSVAPASTGANDAVTFTIRYGDQVSQAVQLPLQNYFSRFRASAPGPLGTSAELVNVGLRDPTARTVDLNAVLPRSAGLRDDGYEWRRTAPGGSPGGAGGFWTPALGDTAPTTEIALIATRPTANGPAGEMLTAVTYAPHAYFRSEPVVFSGGRAEFTIDQADRVSLRDDLGGALQSAVTSNAAGIQDLIYYVTAAPTAGVLYRASDPRASLAAFTDAELAAGTVFYQHSGAAGAPGATTDRFRVSVSTTAYDLAADDLEIAFNVRPLPFVTRNNEAYVYGSNAVQAINTIHPIAEYLSVASNAGFIHILATDRINFIPEDAAFSASNLLAFKFNDLTSLFEPTVGTVDFTVNQRSAADANAVNPIVTDAYYGSLFKRTFTAHLNEFIHSNVVSYPDGVQATDQTLEYLLDPTAPGASNLNERIVSVGLQVYPQQGLIVPPYTDWLNTYAFQLSVVGAGDAPILTVNFTQSNILTDRAGSSAVETSTGAGVGAGADFGFAFGQWGNITLYNRDPDNEGYVSLYINADLFKTKEIRIARNALQGLDVPAFEFADVRAIRVHAVLDGALNLYAGDGAETVTHVATPNEALGLTQTFYLQDYATTLLFRNLELSATTYDFNEVGTAADSDIQNVILGRDVIVRGVNNICIGNRFSTSGANSIILGNDIGVLVTTSDTGVGQINDIYESIIIGNNCYQNSLVRNIISIGRNVLNDLYLSPLAEVNAFLSQSPIIIGNAVTTAYLDYHLNLGNTFLHTVVGGPQIYLGVQSEVVAIGYTSNQLFPETVAAAGVTAAALRVNGGIVTAGPVECSTVTAQTMLAEAYLYLSSNAAAVGDLLLATGTMATPTISYGIVSHNTEASSNVLTQAFALGVVAGPPTAAGGPNSGPAPGDGWAVVQIATCGIASVCVSCAGTGVTFGDYISFVPGTAGRPIVQTPRNRSTALGRALETVAAPTAPNTTAFVKCQLWI